MNIEFQYDAREPDEWNTILNSALTPSVFQTANYARTISALEGINCYFLQWRIRTYGHEMNIGWLLVHKKPATLFDRMIGTNHFILDGDPLFPSRSVLQDRAISTRMINDLNQLCMEKHVTKIEIITKFPDVYLSQRALTCEDAAIQRVSKEEIQVQRRLDQLKEEQNQLRIRIAQQVGDAKTRSIEDARALKLQIKQTETALRQVETQRKRQEHESMNPCIYQNFLAPFYQRYTPQQVITTRTIFPRGPIDDVITLLRSRNARSSIRRQVKAGAQRFEISDGADETAVNAFHHVRRKNPKLPSANSRFYTKVYEELLRNNLGRIFTAYIGDDPVCSIIILCLKTSHVKWMYYWQSATDPHYYAYNPNTLLLWTADCLLQLFTFFKMRFVSIR